MTLPEIARQLAHMTVDGTINGDSAKQFAEVLKDMFRPEVSLKAGDSVVWNVTLHDGNWFIRINRYGKGKDDFNYTVPDTREEEAKIKALLD